MEQNSSRWVSTHMQNVMYPMQWRTYLKFLLETNLGHTFRPETLHHTRTNKLPFGKSTQRMYMLVKTLSFENRFDMSPRIGLEIHILTQTSNNSIYLNQLRSLPMYRIALTIRNVPAMVRLILSTKYLDYCETYQNLSLMYGQSM